MRIICIATAAACLIIAACKTSKQTSNAKKLPGTWQSQPVSIDGDSKEWPSPYPNYDSKAMIAYATSNDKENLYITIETGDALAQMKILRSGLTVYIDTTGKKESVMAIHYPLPSEHTERMNQHEGGDDQLERANRGAQRLQKSIDAATQITFDGWHMGNGGYLVSQPNPNGIVARMAMDEYKELIWEAVVPFSAIYSKARLNKKDEGRPISVCFAIKGIQAPSSQGGSGGSHGGGMGGMHGGGRSGMGGGAGSNYTKMMESTKTWKQFGLAYQ